MQAHTEAANNVIAAAWGILGVAAVLVYAIARLTSVTMDALGMELTAVQWFLLVINIIFMAWSEGYKGFQQRFSPRVAARALHLYSNEMPLSRKILAPLFCCGYFDAPRRTRIAVWVATLAIVAVVVLVQRFTQPWRGVIDAGVVVGLSWGLLSFGYFVQKTFVTGSFYRPPEVT